MDHCESYKLRYMDEAMQFHITNTKEKKLKEYY